MKKNSKNILSYLIHFVFWLVSSAGALWIALQLRFVAMKVYLFFAPPFEKTTQFYAYDSFGRFLYIFIGLIVLVAIVFLDQYLRQGIKKGIQFKRIGLVLLVEGALALLAFLANTFIPASSLI